MREKFLVENILCGYSYSKANFWVCNARVYIAIRITLWLLYYDHVWPLLATCSSSAIYSYSYPFQHYIALRDTDYRHDHWQLAPDTVLVFELCTWLIQSTFIQLRQLHWGRNMQALVTNMQLEKWLSKSPGTGKAGISSFLVCRVMSFTPDTISDTSTVWITSDHYPRKTLHMSEGSFDLSPSNTRAGVMSLSLSPKNSVLKVIKRTLWQKTGNNDTGNNHNDTRFTLKKTNTIISGEHSI